MIKRPLKIEYDDTPDRVVDKINGILDQYGLCFVDDGETHDGFELYELREVTSRGGY